MTKIKSQYHLQNPYHASIPSTAADTAKTKLPPNIIYNFIINLPRSSEIPAKSIISQKFDISHKNNQCSLIINSNQHHPTPSKIRTSMEITITSIAHLEQLLHQHNIHSHNRKPVENNPTLTHLELVLQTTDFPQQTPKKTERGHPKQMGGLLNFSIVSMVTDHVHQIQHADCRNCRSGRV